MNRTIGTLHSPDSLFLRIDVGTATGLDSGTKFELSTDLSRSPLIRCLATGRFWSISWEELMELAVEAGIEEPVGEEG